MAADVRRENGDSRGGHTRDAQCLSQGVGANLGQPLYDLARQPVDPLEGKVAWNTPALLFTRPLDLSFLAPQVAGVLDGRFEARQIHNPHPRVDVELNRSVGEEAFEPHFGLPQQLRSRNAIASSRA